MNCILNRLVYLLMMAFIIFAGCYQPKEGCLDIHATNFDATADENCCCQYPALQLKFQHFSSGEKFQLADTLTNDLGQHFKINSFSFYFSSFEFTGISGAVTKVKDTIQIPASPDPVILPKDVSLVRPTTSNIVLGRLIQEETFNKISFQTGLPSTTKATLISKIPSSSNLSVQIDSLFDANNGYVSLRYVFTNGVDQGSSERFIRIFDNIPFSFDFDLPLKLSYNTCVTIVIDHAAAFYNIDVKNDSDEIVKTKLTQNLKSALIIIPCE